MDSKRIAFVAALGATLLAVAVDPVAAYSSTTESLIRTLNQQLLYAGIPIAVLVEGILIYTVWKFRNNDEPLPTKENRRLEITWTVATAIVLLFVGYASYGVMANQYITTTPQDTMHKEANAVNVEVVGQRYVWTYNYPGENIKDSPELVIPKGRPVYFNVTSVDWIHSFHVPELGLKQDAIPNQHNTIKTKVTEKGTYQVYCAEYCGVGHSNMLSKVKVVSDEEYEQWLKQQQKKYPADGGSNSTAGNSTSGGNSTSA
ncbi:cytochrome c oxidase subunit II (plasmid) [Haladaptatus sp. SPP-AMP-3]|uniref:cytochrome c oxidase subunit II n=1 Tax=Haladaptatus sp. SPP-AMP-3 TaxID=3121295 RepID=UPI003C2F03E5